ncbi:unnamed protein product [Timema podura]|uniref:Uncharacterized protein n=1 Tax=Timema podura TaxID=61482 RepID=A0ABN7NAS8_TIMPD|nr:unnamed protein product [Timema podura]
MIQTSIHMCVGMRKVKLRGSVFEFMWKESGKPFRKNKLQYNRPGSNNDLPVIGSIVYCENDALDHVVIKAVHKDSMSKLANHFASNVNWATQFNVGSEPRWRPGISHIHKLVLIHVLSEGKGEFGNQINLCRDRRIEPRTSSTDLVGPRPTGWETYPQASQVRWEIEACILLPDIRLYLEEEVYLHLSGGSVETHFGKTILSTTDRDSKPNLPIIYSLVYCESSAFNHVAT